MNYHFPKQFIEEYTLYKKFPLDDDVNPIKLQSLKCPNINLHCVVCDERHTFHQKNQIFDNCIHQLLTAEGQILFARYQCQGCSKYTAAFTFFVDPDYKWVMKVGQFPAWEIVPDKSVSSFLNEHRELISKGMICESQSFGVGAYAYYRRIVEGIIDDLLDGISEFANDDEKDKLLKAKDAHRASDKIMVAKEALPMSLKVGGHNPLGLMYGHLSEGIHSLSDDDCQKNAQVLRGALFFLCKQIYTMKKEKDQFKRDLDKLNG